MVFKPIIIAVSVFLLMSIGIYKIYHRFHRPFVHHLSANIQLIGVIVPHNNIEITQDAILNGENNILVVDHASMLYQKLLQKIPQVAYLTQEDLFNIYNLRLFTRDSNIMLTEKDPLFQHLFIIHFYDKGHQQDIHSLTAAGIKGIYSNLTPTGGHEVLMTDGSERLLYPLRAKGFPAHSTSRRDEIP
jgi:hypothetical protein